MRGSQRPFELARCRGAGQTTAALQGHPQAFVPRAALRCSQAGFALMCMVIPRLPRFDGAQGACYKPDGPRHRTRELDLVGQARKKVKPVQLTPGQQRAGIAQYDSHGL